MLKVKTLAAASCNLKHATSNFLVAAVKPARKWAAPKRLYALDALSVSRSVQRWNRPPGGSCSRNRPSSVRQTTDDHYHWRTGEQGQLRWMVRYCWLHVAS